MIKVSPSGLGRHITLCVGDEITEVAGVRISGGASEALSLLRQASGSFDVTVRRERTSWSDLNCSGESTPSTDRSGGSDVGSDEAWGAPTRIMVMKGRDLGITICNHAKSRKGPGVLVERLQADGALAIAGVTVDSALVSVNGKALPKAHASAIAELEHANKDFDGLSAMFEIVIRPARDDGLPKPVVQCL